MKPMSKEKELLELYKQHEIEWNKHLEWETRFSFIKAVLLIGIIICSSFIIIENSIPKYSISEFHMDKEIPREFNSNIFNGINNKAILLGNLNITAEVTNITYKKIKVTVNKNWLNKLKNLEIVDCDNETQSTRMQIEYFCNSSAMGIYFPMNKEIYMKLEDWDQARMITLHELGHHIWHTFLQEHYVEWWCNNYDNQTQLITENAYIDCGEDFAEAFYVYYAYGKAMDHEANLLHHIDETVFNW